MMLEYNEIIDYFKQVKKTASRIKNSKVKHKYVMHALCKYSLEEWCEVGEILRSANMI